MTAANSGVNWVIRLRRNLKLRWTEWVLGYSLLFFAVTILANPETFEDSRLYTSMHYFGSAQMWGLGLILLSLARLVALFVNGQWPPSYMVRIVTSVLSTGIWFNITWSYVIYWLTIAPLPSMALAQVPFLLEVSVIIFASQERLVGKNASGGRK